MINRKYRSTVTFVIVLVVIIIASVFGVQFNKIEEIAGLIAVCIMIDLLITLFIKEENNE